MTDQTLPDWLNVSRETFDGFRSFADLVVKWNPAINLVAKGQLGELWSRHILDSAQIFPLITPDRIGHWVDLGSGGGFPGLVLAIQARAERPDLRFTLVESDRRKSVFLTEVARQLALNVTVRTGRIEDLPPLRADVLSARALAPLGDLCAFALRHLNQGGICLFPKGQSAEAEIAAAKSLYSFDVTRHVSRTEPLAVILELRKLAHV